MNNQIIASCSSCQAQFQVSSDLVGKQGRCPQCQATFTIGGATPSPNPDPRQPGAAFPPPSADPRQPGSVPHPQQFPPQPGVPPQQQFPPQQFYGAPMGMGAGRMEPHRGGVILALGLIGFFVFLPLCIVAIVMGKADLKKMDAGLMDPTGRGSTNAGVILSWVAIGITIAVIALICVLMGAVGAQF